MRSLSHLLATVAFCGAGAAQHPCNTNLLTNGDFATPVPEWVVTGAGTSSFATVDVDATGASRCMQLVGVGPFTLHAPSSVFLDTTTYEVSFDFKRVADGCCAAASVAFDVGIITSSTRTTVTNVTTLMSFDDVMQRCSGVFAPQVAGNFEFDIICTNSGVSFQLDNITIRPVSGAYFHMFDADRRTNAPAEFNLWSNPNTPVALFVSFTPSAPVALPPCMDNPILIGPSVLQVTEFAATNWQGYLATSITVPAVVAGVPLYWQAIAVGSNFCSIGCPTMVAFR